MRNLAKVDFTEKQVENLSLPTIMHMTLTFLTKDKVKQEYLLDRELAKEVLLFL